MRLSTQAEQARRRADLLVARDQALAELVGLLDPDREQSTWRLAGTLAARLARFESAGYARIRRGGRQPYNALEQALCDVLDADTGTSQRRLFDAMAELGLGA